ncbi:MAG: rRNA maturation RNase YbeY [Acidobacteria bacterium]|nr:rRNA maturation RNase YbeY [Acidobacteriota bacterium]
MPQLIDLQRKVRVDRDSISEFAASLSQNVVEANGRDFAVALVSDRRMKELNSLFRGRNDTTDVLSFIRVADEFDPSDLGLGDIVISVEQAQRQAEENGLALELEIKQLVLHGLLHLCGYDHEVDTGEMNERELELRDCLDIG